MLNDERRTVEESYTSATNSSNLRCEADRRTDVDVLIAAGCTPGILGAALMRLHSEWDGCAKPRAMTETDARLLMGNIKTLQDTMTISTIKTEGTDSVLINKDVKVDSFILPMSYHQPEDVFYFEIRNRDHQVWKDTVTVKKENYSHFESVDCGPSFFHTITEVKTTHNYIDSIVINNKEVNYDASKAHFYIYFGNRH